ncbi:MAG: DNRLRE domain-containing protein [Patescibacteria group bacterium]|mgnify:CR=1 FL=1
MPQGANASIVESGNSIYAKTNSGSAATATTTIMNNQSGVVEFDVTSDVQSFMSGSNQNYGWLVKKTNEGQAGQVSFGTKESSNVPQLVTTYQP